MILALGKLDYSGRVISFLKTTHTNLSREGNGFVRDQFLNNSRYMMIFAEAIRQGIMSFGQYRKETIVVTFKDSWGLHYSIVCSVDSSNVTVKTVYTSKKNPWWKHFPKISNRINLQHWFELPAMTKQEYFESIKRAKEIDNEVQAKNQSYEFIRKMNSSGVRRLK